jgi:hypothetical protein
MLSKINIKFSEGVVITQMELEKKLNSYNSEINHLKDSSVFKKSKEQRREIFIELQRKKEDDRIKAEEDKKKKLEMI